MLTMAIADVEVGTVEILAVNFGSSLVHSTFLILIARWH